MSWRRCWPVAPFALAACARISGLDELGEKQPGLGESDERGAVGDAGPVAVPRSDADPGPPPPASDTAGADASASRVGVDGEGPPSLGPPLPPVRLSLSKEGGGTIVSDPPGIQCGDTCSAEFPAGTRVALEALTDNGSLSIFSRWSPQTGCSSERRCVLAPLSQDLAVTATFRQPFNTIFASSARVSPTLGGVREYDRICNELATRAGINGGSVYGDQYLAVMSDSVDSFRDRLGGYLSAWQLANGEAFATTPFELFERDVVLRSVDLDENGARISEQPERRYLTGTLPDGSPAPDNCSNWTNARLSATAGVAGGGPGTWLSGDTVSCSEPRHLLCMSRLSSWQTLLPDAGTRPRIWLSRARFVPGDVTPDEHCRLNVPPGVRDARALVSHVDRPARAALLPDTSLEYVRPDGVVVGTGEDIAAFRARAGLWQASDGVYLSPLRTGSSPDVWTGQTDFDRVGTNESTCNDWTGSEGAGVTGRYDVQQRAFWGEPDAITSSATRGVSCADPAGAHLYCIGSAL